MHGGVHHIPLFQSDSSVRKQNALKRRLLREGRHGGTRSASEPSEEEKSQGRHTPSPSPSTSTESSQLRQRKQIWRTITDDWHMAQDFDKLDAFNPLNSRLHKCARSMVKIAPIPQECRANAWFVISGARDLMAKHTQILSSSAPPSSDEPIIHGGQPLSFTPSQTYLKLFSEPSIFMDRIKKDLNRTFGNVEGFFKRQGSVNELRRVLCAYSNWDKKLGYCQGMNYIAAFLLHVFDSEERAFWTMVALMMNQKYFCRSLFISKLPGFVRCEHALEGLVRECLPKLHDHFKSIEEECIKGILSSWILSLFAYPTISPECTVRLWDKFIITDFSVFIRASFVILLANVSKLLKMRSFMDINEFSKSKGFLTNEIIDRMATIKFAKKDRIIQKILMNVRTLYDEKEALEMELNAKEHKRNHSDEWTDSPPSSK